MDVGGVVAAADGDAAVHDDGKELIVLPLCSRGLRAPLLQGQGQGGLQGRVDFGQSSIGVQSRTETQTRQSYRDTSAQLKTRHI